MSKAKSKTNLVKKTFLFNRDDLVFLQKLADEADVPLGFTMRDVVREWVFHASGKAALDADD